MSPIWRQNSCNNFEYPNVAYPTAHNHWAWRAQHGPRCPVRSTRGSSALSCGSLLSQCKAKATRAVRPYKPRCGDISESKPSTHPSAFAPLHKTPESAVPYDPTSPLHPQGFRYWTHQSAWNADDCRTMPRCVLRVVGGGPLPSCALRLRRQVRR